ncbi:hypothetical protein FDA52_16465 [Clostridium botulinum]|uniref:hypothetical protein n=1 Tax=Clostridium botulinum TaxID=1491 RepID=UPI0007737178|nr:hypothetical protein [Clostridium botulinum]NFE96234.1 hypothetical protein [Clostridium botulinum]NFI54510.1 hypothetical protein [Clostridium botulinum]NFL39773.1 hypothetical protein [Clostridium botulinum]NFL66641.1 hypothetical protein [Clostridium botulinum]NFN09632.1 hypothetical protein [Clostridium botulinum]
MESKYIKVENSKLVINNKSYKSLINHLDTPKLIFVKNVIRENCELIKCEANKILPNKNILCYALKVAPSDEILKIVKECELGVEVYCQKELEMAIRLNINPIVVDGLYKNKRFLEECIKNKVFLINADSINEVIIINDICKSIGVIQNIGLRVKVGPESKMGIDIKEVEDKIKLLSSLKNINLVAVHTHPGSNVKDIEKVYKHYMALIHMFKLLKSNHFDIKYIDLGGNFPEKNMLSDNMFTNFLNVKELFDDYKDLKFIFEPGRYIVADSGILISKIHEIREHDKTLILNLTPSPYFYSTNANFKYEFPNIDVNKFNINSEWKICGVWPTDMDFIPKEKLYKGIPNNVKVGDDFCILNAGAYTLDRANEYVLDEIEVIYI